MGRYYILSPYFRSKAALTYCFWGTAKKHSEPGSLASQDEWMGWWSHLRPITVGCALLREASFPAPAHSFFFKAQQWVGGLICHPPYLPQRIDLSVFRGQRPQQGNVALVPSGGLDIEWTPWTFNECTTKLPNTSCSEVLDYLYQSQLFSKSFWSFVHFQTASHLLPM